MTITGKSSLILMITFLLLIMSLIYDYSSEYIPEVNSPSIHGPEANKAIKKIPIPPVQNKPSPHALDLLSVIGNQRVPIGERIDAIMVCNLSIFITIDFCGVDWTSDF